MQTQTQPTSSRQPDTTSATPQAAGASPERDSRGRFTPGNKGGPGNPFNRRVAALRQVLLQSVSEQDISAIVATLVEQAKGGDQAAAKLVLSYTVGKPTTAVDPDRLDIEEFDIYQQEAIGKAEFMRPIHGMAASLACELLRTVLPVLQKEHCQKGSQMFADYEADRAEDLLDEEQDEDQPTVQSSDNADVTAPDATGQAQQDQKEQRRQRRQARRKEEEEEQEYPSIEEITRLFRLACSPVPASAAAEAPSQTEASEAGTVSKAGETARRAANPGP